MFRVSGQLGIFTPSILAPSTRPITKEHDANAVLLVHSRSFIHLNCDMASNWANRHLSNSLQETSLAWPGQLQKSGYKTSKWFQCSRVCALSWWLFLLVNDEQVIFSNYLSSLCQFSHPVDQSKTSTAVHWTNKYRRGLVGYHVK